MAHDTTIKTRIFIASLLLNNMYIDNSDPQKFLTEIMPYINDVDDKYNWLLDNLNVYKLDNLVADTIWGDDDSVSIINTLIAKFLTSPNEIRRPSGPRFRYYVSLINNSRADVDAVNKFFGKDYLPHLSMQYIIKDMYIEFLNNPRDWIGYIEICDKRYESDSCKGTINDVIFCVMFGCILWGYNLDFCK